MSFFNFNTIAKGVGQLFGAGTGASQIAPNAPQKPFDDAITSMTDIEYRQWVEAQAAKDAENAKARQAMGEKYYDSGFGAKAPQLTGGGIAPLMSMAKGRSGQPQYQDFMQGQQMKLPRGLL